MGDLPTPRTTLRAEYVRLLVWCKACRHQADADLQALVESSRGDVPLRSLRFRCTNCRGRLTDFVVMAKDSQVQPWRTRPLSGTRPGDHPPVRATHTTADHSRGRSSNSASPSRIPAPDQMAGMRGGHRLA